MMMISLSRRNENVITYEQGGIGKGAITNGFFVVGMECVFFFKENVAGEDEASEEITYLAPEQMRFALFKHIRRTE